MESPTPWPRWSRSAALIPLIGAVACGEPEDDGTDAPEPPPLVEKSGTCPDLGSSGLKTFTSSGEERRVGVWLPRDGKVEGRPVVFIWHGLTSPLVTRDSVPEDWNRGFGFDDLARRQDVVVVVPEARESSLVGQPVYLWGFLFPGDDVLDLTLYDDLRTCLGEAGADVARLSSWGFSGGGLWSTVLLRERGDTFATVVVASGGTDAGAEGLTFDGLRYGRPAAKLPVMLVDGGETDVWPDPALPILRFDRGTADLERRLVADGHFVVSCHHTLGHAMPDNLWKAARQWMLRHVWGEPSPYQEGDQPIPNGCEIAG